MIEFDSKIIRLKKQYQGLSRLMTSISDLYIYGIYPQNYPNLSVVLDQTKDHVKQLLKETKIEMATLPVKSPINAGYSFIKFVIKGVTYASPSANFLKAGNKTESPKAPEIKRQAVAILPSVASCLSPSNFITRSNSFY